MTKPLRACPLCPKCGSKKFRKLEQVDLILIRCKKCGHDMKI